MKPKELEEHCLKYFEVQERRGLAQANRYGVQVAMVDGELIRRPSLPDVEGATRDSRQFVFDCKIVSGASVEFRDDHMADRQRTHMYRKSKMGVASFLLVHFNPRELATKTDPAETYAIAVDDRLQMWIDFEQGDRKRLNRHECRDREFDNIFPVLWDLPTSRAKLERPILLPVIDQLRRYHAHQFGHDDNRQAAGSSAGDCVSFGPALPSSGIGGGR